MRRSISVILMKADERSFRKDFQTRTHKTDISALQLRAIIKYAPK